MKRIYLIMFLSSLLAGCLKDDEMKPAGLDKIITLTVSDTLSLTANGSTRISLLASLPTHTDVSGDYKKVTFETTAGTLQGSSKLTKDVNFDTDGNAKVDLIVSDQPGIFYVAASIGTTQVYRIEYPIYARPVAVSDKIKISLSDTIGLKADNTQQFKVTAQITNSIEKSVKFTISEGFILGVGDQKVRTIPLDQIGKAEIYIKTDINVTPYLLSAEVNSLTSLRASLPIRRAYADSLYLEPSPSIKIDSIGGTVTIKAILFREVGKVSSQTPVYFDAYQLDNLQHEKPVGRFTGITNSLTDNTGQVTVGFVADTRFFYGSKPITIRVKTKNDAGNYVIKKMNLYFK